MMMTSDRALVALSTAGIRSTSCPLFSMKWRRSSRNTRSTHEASSRDSTSSGVICAGQGPARRP